MRRFPEIMFLLIVIVIAIVGFLVSRDRNRFQQTHPDAEIEEVTPADANRKQTQGSVSEDIIVLSASDYLNTGMQKYERGDYFEAITDFDEAIRLDPKFAGAYRWRGNAKYELRQHDDAISDYDKAIRLNRKDAHAYYKRACAKMIYLPWSRDDVIEDCNKVIQLIPKSAAAYNLRGVAKEYNRKYFEALQDFDKAIRLSPDSLYYANRGRVKRHLGDESAAQKDFGIALKLAKQAGDTEQITRYRNLLNGLK